MKPGRYLNIAESDYHNGPGISKSGLDLVNQSPLHYWDQYRKPNAKRRASTPAQLLGTRVHRALLEPEKFAQLYVKALDKNDYPGLLETNQEITDWINKNSPTPTKKKLKADLIAEALAINPDVFIWDHLVKIHAVRHVGKEVISAHDWESIIGMCESILAHPAANIIMGAGESEVSYYWTDPETNELCRCRVDRDRADDLVVDIKTTTDASREAFAKQINNERYHVQGAFYTDGRTAVTGKKPKAFILIAVEKQSPYAVAVYGLSPEALELGRRDYRGDLAAYAKCNKSGKFPGYSEQIQMIGLPDFVMRREEFQARTNN